MKNAAEPIIHFCVGLILLGQLELIFKSIQIIESQKPIVKKISEINDSVPIDSI